MIYLKYLHIPLFEKAFKNIQHSKNNKNSKTANNEIIKQLKTWIKLKQKKFEIKRSYIFIGNPIGIVHFFKSIPLLWHCNRDGLFSCCHKFSKLVVNAGGLQPISKLDISYSSQTTGKEQAGKDFKAQNQHLEVCVLQGKPVASTVCGIAVRLSQTISPP